MPSPSALIGSGLSGLETAAFLAQDGNQLEIVEMAEKIGPGIGFQLLTDAKAHLAAYPVTYLPAHRLVRVFPDAVELEHNGATVALRADRVVLALGVRGNPALAETLKEQADGPVVLSAGDVLRSGRICDAVHSAFDAAYHLS